MDKNYESYIKPILAIIIVLGAFIYFFAVTFTGVKADPQIVIAIVGLQLVPVGYYFGGSSGSAKKDQTIQDLTNKNNQ